jgi:hypothetical protein
MHYQAQAINAYGVSECSKCTCAFVRDSRALTMAIAAVQCTGTRVENAMIYDR